MPKLRKLRNFLGLVVIFILIAACVVFLYVNFGPDCARFMPHEQRSTACTCQGIELARAGVPDHKKYSSSVCLGVISDHWINFNYWNESNLTHSDRIIVRAGSKVALDSSDAKIIRTMGEVFNNLSRNWHQGSSTAPAPDYQFVFVSYVPAENGKGTEKKETWFGMGPDHLEIQGGMVRPLNESEKNLLLSLVSPYAP